MSDEKPILSENLTAKIRELCARICAAETQGDDAVQRELRAHLEDKAISYQTGEQRLSDEDILLLIERHLGDARELQIMLRRNPATPDSIGAFLRRFAAIVLATTVASIFQQVWTIIANYAALLFQHDDAVRFIAAQTNYMLSFGVLTAALIAILINWQRGAARHPSGLAWFQRIGIIPLSEIVTLTLVGRWLLPYMSPHAPIAMINVQQLEWIRFMQIVSIACTVIAILIWVAWCAIRSRAWWQPAAHAGVALMAFVCVTYLTSAAWGIELASLGVPANFRIYWRIIALPHSLLPVSTEAVVIGTTIVAAYVLVARRLQLTLDRPRSLA
ncbi:hypothetical protein BH09PLA1_BH09PLA1_13390 [soil metagenome]